MSQATTHAGGNLGVRVPPQETILGSDKVRDAARKRREEREAAVTLEERVALNAANKEQAAVLKRKQVPR